MNNQTLPRNTLLCLSKSGLSPQSARRGEGCRDGFTMVELLIVIAILGILMAILLPAIGSVKESARMASCQNNMRQLGKGLQAYESRHNAFPPAYTGFDSSTEGDMDGDGIADNDDNCPGQPNGSLDSEGNQKDKDGDGEGDACDEINNNYETYGYYYYDAMYKGPSMRGSSPWKNNQHVLCFILNYLELDYLGGELDLTKDWNDPVNASVTNQVVPLFLCPSAPSRPDDHATDYTVCYEINKTFIDELEDVGWTEFVSGEGWTTPRTKLFHSLLQPHNRRSTASVKDGLSNTFMLVERAGLPYIYEDGKYIERRAGNENWAGYETPLPITEIQSYGNDYRVINLTNDQEIYSFHPGGAIFLYGDGGVRFESEDMSFLTFANLFTADGGEVEFREQ